MEWIESGERKNILTEKNNVESQKIFKIIIKESQQNSPRDFPKNADSEDKIQSSNTQS